VPRAPCACGAAHDFARTPAAWRGDIFRPRIPISDSEFSARDRARKIYDASIVVIAEQICCVAARMWRAELPLFPMEQSFFTID
jgi:hypothetical protein